MQFLDSYVEYTAGDEEEARRVRKVPITNLKRLLESAPVRERLGISIADGGWAFSKYPVDEIFKWLRRMIHDLTSGKTKVKSIYDTKKMLEYIDGFAEHELPDPDKTLSQPIPVVPLGRTQPPPPSKKPKTTKLGRWTLRSAKIQPQHSRLQDIVRELESVSFERAPNIHAVMLRVFLELSVDDFNRRHKIEVRPDNANRVTLRARILEATNFAEKEGWIDKKQASAVRKVTGSSMLNSAKTLSDFLHNQNLHPAPSDVETLWKNLSAFIAKVHEN